MDSSILNVETSQQIELCESYLVCGMFEEAAKLASSILDNGAKRGYEQNNLAIRDAMESAAMVLIQSLGELERASEILNLLKDYFGSVKAIPVQVLVPGACIQVSRSVTTATVQEFVEDFLANWQLGDQGYFIAPVDSASGCESHVLRVEEYLEVAQFYALALLGTAKKDAYSSISWVESAQLPEEARQDLLRRLQSLCLRDATSLPQIANASSQSNESKTREGETNNSDKTQSLATNPHVRELGHEEKSFLNWPRNLGQCFYWIRNCTLKTGNCGAVACNMKILLGCFLFVICYILRKKRRLEVMRYVKVKAISLKKALMDFWQLAFSYQVNPLAAMQALPSTNSSS